MALITIRDLPQSDVLDREAMQSIVGGGHILAHPVRNDLTAARNRRILEYPPGFASKSRTVGEELEKGRTPSALR
jgi:hypothetical protein